MRSRIYFLTAALAMGLPAAETRLLHQPSYHNGNVVFVFQNDLWIAAENGSAVRRLTATKAVESLPRFSPDGKWIAYTSNREGYQAVFAIPSSGGISRQLTYFGGDRVVGWTPDSSKVLFASQRGVGFGGTLSLWDVPLDGGMERQIIADRSAFGSYSPDQKYLAYNRHGSQGYRKHYRGSSAADIWIMDTAANTFRRLSDPEIKCDEAWPMYSKDGAIYFASDRMPDEKRVKPGSPEVMKSISNIWKIPGAGGKAIQVTQHATGGVFIPSMSGDGRTIVYEQDFGIWKLDIATGKSSEIKIRIDGAEREAPVRTLTIDSVAETFDMSPSTKRAAIASHGLILTIATEAGEVQKVTDAVAHDRLPRWSPDAKTIAFLSDRSGRDEVWLSDERGSTPRQLTNADGDKGALMWASDSKSLFYTSENRLVRTWLADGKQEVSVEEGIGIQSAQVSPDGKWLAYAVSTPSDLIRTYIKPLAGGAAHNVSRKGFSRSYSPAWTPDGKRLLMLVSNAGAVDKPQSMLFAVNLQRETDNPNYKGIDTEVDAAKATAQTGAGAKAPVDVKIDWDDLDRRTRQISRLAEHINSFAISPDGKTYALVSGGQVYAIDDEGARQNRLTQPGAGAPAGLQFSKDGRSIFFREGNTIYVVATTPSPQAAGPAPAKRKIAFTARFTVDFNAQRKVVFNEAWRVIRNRYYNKALNGVDWEAVRKQYEPLLEFADDQEGMADVIRMMIGELNTSHTTAFVPLPPGTPRAGNAFPGFEVVPDSSGFYKISRVLKRGPADRDYSRIKVGDYLLAVNGAPVKSGENYWKAYRTATGRAIQFTLNSQPKLEGSWHTSLPPAVDPRTLYYDEWVAERRAKVEELSGGDFAYIHLRIMSPEIMQQFEEDLYEARFKKGLVIDVRFNGGGNLEMELLKIVQQKAYMNLVTRNGVVFPRPYRGFYGSMIVLQNENSGSNAEMFPLGFRELGLGKLVGVTTPGQVLLGSDIELSDGTHMGIAHGTVQTLEGRNLENNGVKPDIHIDNLPEDAMKGRDAQLEKAVESLRQTVSTKGPK